MGTWRALAVRLFFDDSGQDLIEYGLLTGITLASGFVVYSTISGKLSSQYAGWTGTGGTIQSNWQPSDPQ